MSQNTPTSPQHTPAEQEAFEDGRLRLLGSLLGSIIHEVNNPLAIGMGRMQQLKTLIDLENETILKTSNSITLQFDRIREILMAAKRLAIFGYSQGTSAVESKHIIENVDVLLAERCRRHGITLEFQEMEADWKVESNIDGVVTLMVATLLEAIEFMRTQKEDVRSPIYITFAKGTLALEWPFQRPFVRNEFIRVSVAKLGLKYVEAKYHHDGRTLHRCLFTFPVPT